MKSNFLIFVLIGAVVLGGLFFVFKPQENTKPTDNTAKIQEVTTRSTPASHMKVFELVVKKKKLVLGDDVLKVTQGDNVTIKITVDEEEELHLHGYDKSVDLEPDKEAELTFTADMTGRFSYELEYQGLELGALEVQPK